MVRPANVRQHRLANAFFTEAQINRQTARLLGGGVSGLKHVQRALGGLWVGGDAYLTDTAFVFEPNGINKAVHAAPETLSVLIPLSRITHTRDRFGIVTRIIDISVESDNFSVRCFGAKSFATKIAKAAASARSTAA